MKTSKQIQSLIKRYLIAFPVWNDLREKSILITGGKGTIGTALIHLLLAANKEYNLGLQLHVSTRNPAILPDYIENSDPVVWIQNGDEEAALTSESINYIIHAACPTDRNFFKEHPATTYLTIIHDTERMLSIANKKKATMLYFSSDAEFGSIGSSEPIGDDYYGPLDPLNPRSCYPLGKKSSVYLCCSSAQEFGIDVKTIRLSIVTGLFQRYDDPKVMSYFLRCLHEGEKIVLHTTGETKKQLIFSFDAATACLYVLLYGITGKVYNATNPEVCMTIREYAEYLSKEYGNDKTKVVYEFLDENTTGFAAPSQLEMRIDGLTDLGWRPLVGLDEIFQIDLRRFSYETDQCS